MPRTDTNVKFQFDADVSDAQVIMKGHAWRGTGKGKGPIPAQVPAGFLGYDQYSELLPTLTTT